LSVPGCLALCRQARRCRLSVQGASHPPPTPNNSSAGASAAPVGPKACGADAMTRALLAVGSDIFTMKWDVPQVPLSCRPCTRGPRANVFGYSNCNFRLFELQALACLCWEITCVSTRVAAAAWARALNCHHCLHAALPHTQDTYVLILTWSRINFGMCTSTMRAGDRVAG